MDSLSKAEWVARVADTAHGRVVWNAIADCSPWDGFYRDYQDASADCRQEIDQAFVDCAQSDDPLVLEAVIAHAQTMPARTAVTLLLGLLDGRSAFLQEHQQSGSERTLLGLLLGALASRAASDGAHFLAVVRDAILAWAPRAGGLPSSVGTFFGGLGPAAVDALVAVLPGGPDNARVLVDTGYELHRDAATWAHALAIAEAWPPAVREAVLCGAAEHAARFPAP